jgi:hypothetical protein
MAEEGKGEGKKSLWGQILPPVAVALLVGGTYPWWLKPLFVKPSAGTTAITQQPAARSLETAPVASREFFVGEWHTEVNTGSASGANTTDYYKDGTFDGHYMGSYTQGQSVHTSGRWEVEPLSEKQFRLHIQMNPGVALPVDHWIVRYKILDRNHIENMDNGNNVVKRVE